MKSVRTIKNVNTYIKDMTNALGKDIITVEHRSNNPKRDYLFVNKLQCKHIPCSPTAMINMCKQLAFQVESKLLATIDVDSKILVVGFAETATAIGSRVAKDLSFNTYVMHTTREKIKDSKELIRFEEEHSHATTQKLLTWEDTKVTEFLSEFDYVLFVEDEISTGNTILNFIKAFKKAGLAKERDLRFGVASICNWQNKENTQLFKENNIDVFCLIRGELKDTSAKMLDENTELLVDTTENIADLEAISDITDLQTDYTVFNSERLGYSKTSSYVDEETIEYMVEHITKLAKDNEADSVRIIGTEEFMELPIIIGEKLEQDGLSVICHSTTRSKIDVIDSIFDGEADGIKVRHQVESAYDSKRKTYIYNTNEETDLAVIISDSPNMEQFKKMVQSVTNTLNIMPNNVYSFRV